MPDDLDRVVDARIALFRPDRTPPFSVVEERHRARIRLRKAAAAAAALVAAVVTAPVAWSAATAGEGGSSLLRQANTGPQRLDRSTGPTAGPFALAVVSADSSGMVHRASPAPGAVSDEVVSLPGFLRNNGAGPVVVSSMQVVGTDLRAEMPPDVSLNGKSLLPLAFVRSVDCRLDGALPEQLNLNVTVLVENEPTVIVLPLPSDVAVLDRTSHACTATRRAVNTAGALRQGGPGLRPPSGAEVPTRPN